MSPAHVLPGKPQAPVHHQGPRSPVGRKRDDEEEPASENHSLDPQLRLPRGTAASTCDRPGGTASKSL